MEEKPKLSFLQQAARASWILPLANIGLMAIGNSAMQGTKSPVSDLVMGGTFLLLLVSGLVFGIVGCFGSKRHGAKTTIIPGLVGAVLNAAILGMLVAIAVPSFMKARSSALHKRTDALQKLVDNTNSKLPVMVDSETRVDRMAVVSPTLVECYYTFLDTTKSEFDAEAYVAETRPQYLESYLSGDHYKMFRENDIAIRYCYYDKNGQPLTNIVVSKKEISNQ